MAYELRAGDNLGEGVRRVCRAQIKLAVEASRAAAEAEVSSVHATRRHLKKARAALRLMCRHVQRAEYQREHRKLRNVGRLISEVRDAEVRLGTVQALRRQIDLRSDASLQHFEDLLGLELESFFAAFSGWQKQAQANLEVVRRRMAAWHLVHLDCKQIRRTVQTTYKRGRRSLAAACAEPTAENFHEFRKQVKELFFHLRILRPLHPARFGEAAAALKMLAERLGQANDLAFLEDRLVALHGADDDLHALEQLCTAIAAQRTELQRTAREVGGQFYADRPRDFGRRLRQHFESWKSGSAQRNGRALSKVKASVNHAALAAASGCAD